jgi:DNA polymerase-3 subunit beta
MVMKLSIDRSVLLKALSHTQTVVERKAVSPILSNVLLEAEGNHLKISATDLDISIIENIPAVVMESGSTTVSAHMFYDIVRKLPEGSEIELSEKPESNLISLKCGKTKFSLSTLNAKDFTNIKTTGLPHSFVLPASVLSHLIASTRFSMSTEETRYYLNGIYLHTKETDQRPLLCTVATDGHRLALAETDQPQGAHGMPNVIIPKKTIAEISKLLDEAEGDVEISLSHTQITFNFGSALIASRLIDGSFPDYEKIIPQNNNSSLTVSRKQFLEAVDRISTISLDKTRSVKMNVEHKHITISASTNNQGSGTEELEATYDGQRFSAGFNARYFLDIAQQIKSETIAFKISDENAPAIMKGVGEDDVLYILMPMRV